MLNLRFCWVCAVAGMAEKKPSIGRQKTFIVENAGVLDKVARETILRIVMMEVGRVVPGAGVPVVLEHGAAKTPSIDLDALGRHKPEVLRQVYNIVAVRRNLLNEPAGGGRAA